MTLAEKDLGRKIELTWLMDFYGGMLTEKQQEILSLYCEEDLSLGEIARMTGISRQGVHEQITRAAEKLNRMEETTGAAERFRKMQEGLAACRAALLQKDTETALRLLDGMLQPDQEEENGL